MELINASVLLLVLTLVSCDAWKLRWSDEFNGNSLDRNVWNIEVDCNGGGNGEYQCYTDRRENIRVANGQLTITARQEDYNGKKYTSGRLRMKTDGFKYGRYVIRARLPKGKHIWPAIWMLPARGMKKSRNSYLICLFIADVYGTWAASGEIDIMEYRGQRPNLVEGQFN